MHRHSASIGALLVAMLLVVDSCLAACTEDDLDTRCSLGLYFVPCARKRDAQCCLSCAFRPKEPAFISAITPPPPPPISPSPPPPQIVPSLNRITCVERVVPIPHKPVFTSCQEYDDLLYDLQNTEEGKVVWLHLNSFSASACPLEYGSLTDLSVSHTIGRGCRGQTTIAVVVNVTVGAKYNIFVEQFLFDTRKPTLHDITASNNIHQTRCVEELDTPNLAPILVDTGSNCDGERILVPYFSSIVRREEIMIDNTKAYRITRQWDTFADNDAKTQTCLDDRVTEYFDIHDMEHPVIRPIGETGETGADRTLFVECFSELEAYEMEAVDNCAPAPVRIKPESINVEWGDRQNLADTLRGHLLFSRNDSSGNTGVFRKRFVVKAITPLLLQLPLQPLINVHCPSQIPRPGNLTGYAVCSPNTLISLAHIVDTIVEIDNAGADPTKQLDYEHQGCSSPHIIQRVWKSHGFTVSQKIKVGYRNPLRWTTSSNDMPLPKLAYQCLSQMEAVPVLQAIHGCTGNITNVPGRRQSLQSDWDRTETNNVTIKIDWTLREECANHELVHEQLIHIHDTMPPSYKPQYKEPNGNRFCLARHSKDIGTCFTNVYATLKDKYVAGDNCGGPVHISFVRLSVHACSPEDDRLGRKCSQDPRSSGASGNYTAATDTLCLHAGTHASNQGLEFIAQFVAQDAWGNYAPLFVEIRVPTSDTSPICDRRHLIVIPGTSLVRKALPATHTTVLGQVHTMSHLASTTATSSTSSSLSPDTNASFAVAFLIVGMAMLLS